MAQRTTGIYRLTQIPAFYNLFQKIVGEEKFQKIFFGEVIRTAAKENILDIGCGTAQYRNRLGDVVYSGIDINPAHIEYARKRYAGDTFFCGTLEAFSETGRREFDKIMLIGVLHHIDDDTASSVLRICSGILAPAGRLFTLDPVLEDRQNPIARALIRLDSGRNVRKSVQYRDLASPYFDVVEASVRRDLLHIPYSHNLLICSNV